MLSAGIRYQITPSIGIGVYANSMFGGANKQKSEDFSGEQITVDVSRKLNRVGLSAGFDFSF